MNPAHDDRRAALSQQLAGLAASFGDLEDAARAWIEEMASEQHQVLQRQQRLGQGELALRHREHEVSLQVQRLEHRASLLDQQHQALLAAKAEIEQTQRDQEAALDELRRREAEMAQLAERLAQFEAEHAAKAEMLSRCEGAIHRFQGAFEQLLRVRSAKGEGTDAGLPETDAESNVERLTTGWERVAGTRAAKSPIATRRRLESSDDAGAPPGAESSEVVLERNS